MDKQSTMGFVLIGVILIAWMWLQSPPAPKPGQMPDSTHAAAQPVKPVPAPVAVPVSREHDPGLTGNVLRRSRQG